MPTTTRELELHLVLVHAKSPSDHDHRTQTLWERTPPAISSELGLLHSQLVNGLGRSELGLISIPSTNDT